MLKMPTTRKTRVKITKHTMTDCVCSPTSGDVKDVKRSVRQCCGFTSVLFQASRFSVVSWCVLLMASSSLS